MDQRLNVISLGVDDVARSRAFADPDGHTWEVANIAALALHDDGTVELPS